MNTLILDGSAANDPQAEELQAALLIHQPQAQIIPLREQKIGNCAGDFFCWVRNPGICNVDDDNRKIAAQIMHSNLLVFLTPVTFGGYSTQLKRMVDHMIPLISPFFALRQGEIHHQRRYTRYPRLLVIGWLPAPEERAEAIFHHLVQRNAINFYAPVAVSGVVYSGQSPEQRLAQVGAWLSAIAAGQSSATPALPEIPAEQANGGPVNRAVLLVGSPRGSKSSSAALGGALMQQLAQHGVATETLALYPAFSSAERTQHTLATLESADLLVLAHPLYVDSLPAPVTAALEKIAAHRLAHPFPARFATISNCGFPEAAHNAPALAIAAEFARQSGLSWAGGLALGGGEGLVHGVPLDQLDGRAIPLKRSLELAAEALAQGESIPAEARELMARPVIPPWLYRVLGGFGWRQQARQYGVQKQLSARPYEVK